MKKILFILLGLLLLGAIVYIFIPLPGSCPMGSRVWSTKWNQYISRVVESGSGDLYVAGLYGEKKGRILPSGETINRFEGGSDLFIGRVSAKGSLEVVVSMGSSGDDQIACLYADETSGILVSGYNGGDIDLDPGNGVMPSHGRGTFILKLDPDLKYQWSNNWNSPDDITAVAEGPRGTWFASGSVYMPPTDQPKPYDLVLLQFDSDGQMTKSSRLGNSPKPIYANSICLDKEGNLYVFGMYEDQLNIIDTNNAFQLSSAGMTDLFMCKIDKNQSVEWAQTWGGPSGDFPSGLALDGYDNIYASGWFIGQSTFGMTVLSGKDPDVATAFLLKLQPNGTQVFAQSWGNYRGCQIHTITIDSHNIIYLGGKFSGGSLDFDQGPAVHACKTPCHRCNSGFVLELLPSGEFKQVRKAPVNLVVCLALGKSDALYVTGSSGEGSWLAKYPPSY